MQDILSTLATVTEIAIAAVIVIGAFNPRPCKIEVSVTVKPEIPAPPAVEPAITPEATITAPAPKVSRIAELRTKFGTTITAPAPIAPHLTAADVEAALTAATVTPEVPTVSTVQSPIALPTTSTALRKLCSEHGIRWGHINGRNRHATPDQMIAALSAVVSAA